MVDLETFLDSETSASLLTPSLVDPFTVKNCNPGNSTDAPLGILWFTIPNHQ